MVYIGTGQAIRILNIQKEQLYKLTRAGIIRDYRPSGARNWRFDAEEVMEVVGWKSLNLPENEEAIAVHLAELRSPHESDTRLVMGYHEDGAASYSPRDLEMAWVGNWPFSEAEADASIGKILLGDVAGWIPKGLGRRVTGYSRLHDGSVRFEVESLLPAEVQRYTERRIKALPGQVWQRCI